MATTRATTRRIPERPAVTPYREGPMRRSIDPKLVHETPTDGPFLETDGLLVVEAEHYVLTASREGQSFEVVAGDLKIFRPPFRLDESILHARDLDTEPVHLFLVTTVVDLVLSGV